MLLEVPRDILKQTALTNARSKVSSRAQVLAYSELINKSGGNLDDFVISHSSANRKRNSVVKEAADSVKETFKEKYLAGGKQFVVHFDTKCVEDYTG